MGLEGIMLSEVSQTKKDKYHISLIMWNVKTKQMNEQTNRDTENKPKAGWG